MIQLLPWAFLLALTAFVYCFVLTDGGMILNFWFNFLDRWIGPTSATNQRSGTGALYDSPNVKPRCIWLFKMLVGCCKCVAGQFACWGFFYVINRQVPRPYDPVEHVIFISFAIYTVKFIAQAYTWKTNS